MPLHGLKADLELAGLVLTAVAASVFVSGRVFSNILFTALLVSLFFLMGLNVDLSFFQSLRNRGRQLMVALAGIFLISPLVALIMSYAPGDIGQALLIVGISASAFGSPKVWASISNSDGELASKAASFSLFGSMIFIPALLYLLPVQIDTSLLLENSVYAAVPFLIGVISQSYENRILEDMRLHFSKLSFWLIVTITGVQARLLYVSDGILSLTTLFLSSLLFVVLIVMSFGYSHIFGRLAGLYEKEARSIGYISSSKSIGIALLLAAHVSGETILLVCLYYFIRQLSGIAITDLYLHGETRMRDRLSF